MNRSNQFHFHNKTMLINRIDSEFLRYLLTNGCEPGTRLPSLDEISGEIGISTGKLREQFEVARMLGLVDASPRRGIVRTEYSFLPAVRLSLLAALQIVESPGRYGLTLPAPDATPPPVAVARVERSVKLDRVDAVLGLPAGTLAELNPELRRQATPRRAYDLRVPAGQEGAVLAGLDALPEWTPPPAPRYATHRVRSGETLSTIARRYGTSVSALMRANALASPNRLRVGQRLRVPARGAAAGDD